MQKYTLLVAILVACGCGSNTPTAPPETPLPPAAVQLDGTWTGAYELVGCSSPSMGTCSRLLETDNGGHPFTLVVTQHGSSVSAQYAEVLLPGQDAPLAGSVEGMVSALQVGLDGPLSWDSRHYANLSGHSFLHAPSLTSDPTGLHITGRFTLVDLNSTGGASTQRTCEIIRLERSGP